MARIQPKREKVNATPGFYRVQLADGYRYEFRAPGTRKPVYIPRHEATTKDEAIRWRNKYLGTNEHERIVPSKATFAEVFEVVKASYRRRASTLAGHEAAMRTHLQPIARMKVQDIDRNVLMQRVIKPMEEKGLSGSSVHNVLMTASLVFEASIDAKVITINPVRRLKSGRDKPSRKVTRSRTTLSATQFAALLEHAPGHYKPIFALMGLAGLRLSEALGLIWSEVLFDRGQLNITAQLAARSDERVALKTEDSKGLVDMSPMLAQILATHSLTGLAHPDDYVFLTDDAKPYSQRRVQYALGVTCGKAKIPVIVPHELRHTCGSALLVATRDPAITAKQMRHANPQITLAIYAHEWGALSEAGAVGAALDASLGANLSD